ncbi:MAG: class I SAM-dependent methyltransferase, partial [Candidatus Limnocylindrales bacterium]
MADTVTTFCPACLRWSNDEAGERHDVQTSCSTCGSNARERFVTLLLGATARDATGRPGRTIGIAASPSLATAIERIAADVVLVPDARASGVDDAAGRLVVCADVPRSLPDPDGLLGEIRRILSPDGMCIVAFPPDAGSGMDEYRHPPDDDLDRRDPSTRPPILSDQPEASFAAAGFRWRRVVPQHTLPIDV